MAAMGFRLVGGGGVVKGKGGSGDEGGRSKGQTRGFVVRGSTRDGRSYLQDQGLKKPLSLRITNCHLNLSFQARQSNILISPIKDINLF